MAPALLAAIAITQFTVSPDGPLKTPQAARDAVRAARTHGKRGPAVITLRGGTYFLGETLRLTAEDSDTVWQAAPGEHVIVSGGRVVNGWAKDGAVWTAPVGEARFRQLFVGGRRAVRARVPAHGFYRIDGASSQDKPFTLRYRGSDIRKEWAGTGVEVVALLAWADLRMPIASVDEAAHVARLAGDPQPSNRETDARYYVENTPEGLAEPGSWYLDAAARAVRYRPLEGDRLVDGNVIAANLEQLVHIDGARGVAFRRIEFAQADWSLPAAGYADTQAAVHALAAIEAVNAEECAIEHCTIAHAGGYGVWFGRGSRRNRVTASEFYDLGAGGIKLGEPLVREAAADRNYGNIIADNHLHALGRVYAPAVGIWVLQSGRNEIVHNHVHDLYYTAISVGWTWGYGPNLAAGNRIAFNHLHDIGRGMLSDMGAIYTLGAQPGTVIANNLIHDVEAFTYGGWGIYPDEGSTGIVIENNIVYGCKSAGFHQHYGRENIVRNNVFAFNREHQLMRTRAEPHSSFTFERNIVYFDDGRLLGSNWTGPNFTMRGNVYFDRRSGAVEFAGETFAEWQAAGRDTGSVVADPLFVNAANNDFRLRPGSPALTLGFAPIDVSDVGPRESPGAR